jgi:hypothetical protein
MKGCCVYPYDAQGRPAADVRAGSNRIDQTAAVLGLLSVATEESC